MDVKAVAMDCRAGLITTDCRDRNTAKVPGMNFSGMS